MANGRSRAWLNKNESKENHTAQIVRTDPNFELTAQCGYPPFALDINVFPESSNTSLLCIGLWARNSSCSSPQVNNSVMTIRVGIGLNYPLLHVKYARFHWLLNINKIYPA
jgi:hypothetical protein